MQYYFDPCPVGSTSRLRVERIGCAGARPPPRAASAGRGRGALINPASKCRHTAYALHSRHDRKSLHWSTVPMCYTTHMAIDSPTRLSGCRYRAARDKNYSGPEIRTPTLEPRVWCTCVAMCQLHGPRTRTTLHAPRAQYTPKHATGRHITRQAKLAVHAPSVRHCR